MSWYHSSSPSPPLAGGICQRQGGCSQEAPETRKLGEADGGVGVAWGAMCEYSEDEQRCALPCGRRLFGDLDFF